MRIRILLNRCEHLKSFAYEIEYLEQKHEQEVLIIKTSSRKTPSYY